MKKLPFKINKNTIGGYFFVDTDIYNLIKNRTFFLRNGYPYYHTAKHGGTLAHPKCGHVYVHRLVMNFPVSKIDHINRNKLDSRRKNLRLVTDSENAQNCNKHADNTSGYRNVTWDKSKKKWSVTICKNYKRHFVGRFDDIEEANKQAILKRQQLGFLE